MAGYANVLGRADLTDVQVPDQVINEVLQEAPSQSAILQRARTVRMSSKKTKQPVLASLPDAYWVDGDTGLKQTTKSDWDNIVMTAEELAVIVPIPDAVVSDAGVPLWTWCGRCSSRPSARRSTRHRSSVSTSPPRGPLLSSPRRSLPAT